MTQAKAYDGEETADTGSGNSEKPEQPEAVEPAESNQKLVYTCWMTIQTLEFDKTQSSVKDAVKKVGGIIESDGFKTLQTSLHGRIPMEFPDTVQRSDFFGVALIAGIPQVPDIIYVAEITEEEPHKEAPRASPDRDHVVHLDPLCRDPPPAVDAAAFPVHRGEGAHIALPAMLVPLRLPAERHPSRLRSSL